jgi:hypothetical protein
MALNRETVRKTSRSLGPYPRREDERYGPTINFSLKLNKQRVHGNMGILRMIWSKKIWA